MNNPTSPFLTDELEFENFNSRLEENQNRLIPIQGSPFLNEFVVGDDEMVQDPILQELNEIIDELYDEEFEEALEELAHEANVWFVNQLGSQVSSGEHELHHSNQLVNHFASPILQEVDRFMDYNNELANRLESGELSEDEFSIFIDQYQPLLINEHPEFDFFFKKLKKWGKRAVRSVRKVAKKAAGFAKKIGLGPILKKLRRIVKKFVGGFLNKAMRKIPAPLRPLAQKLRKKYLRMELPSIEGEEEFPIQYEMNYVIAEMLLANSQHEIDQKEALFLSDERKEDISTEEILSNARERFVQALGELEEGEDPGPAVEEFVGAVLVGLRWAIRLIGKKRVKAFLIKILSGIAKKFLGDSNARKLSSFIIDQGFKLLRLELSEQEVNQLGHRAIASTLEDTLLEVSQLPDQILEDEALLEASTLEAFEKAAVVNMPDFLPQSAYRKRPKLREAIRHRTMWMPVKMRKAKRFLYKKLNKAFEVELSPYVMEEVKVLNGVPLKDYLNDTMGLDTNQLIPATVHVFELMPGGTLRDIAENEEVFSKGELKRFGNMQLHPFTSKSAGLLIGEPKVGCKSKGSCLRLPSRGKNKHRYYYLQIAQSYPQVYHKLDGTMAIRKPSNTRLKLDFSKNKIIVNQFFSETIAQKIAQALRKGNAGKGNIIFLEHLENGIKRSFKYPQNGQLSVLHPMVMPGPQSGSALGQVPALLKFTMQDQLSAWLLPQISKYLTENSAYFIEATQNEADGVTVKFELLSPPGLKEMDKYLSRQTDELLSPQAPDITMTVKIDYEDE